MDGILARIRRRNHQSEKYASLPMSKQADRRETSGLLTTTPLSEDSFAEKGGKRKQDARLVRRTFGKISLAAMILLLTLLLVLTIIAAMPKLRRYYRRHLRTVHPDTFTHECKHNFLNNDAWGRFVAPYADKHQVKELVRSIFRAEGRETLLKIAPTLAHYDIHNVSLFTKNVMQSLPQPYLLKPTHTCGGMARVMNDTYQCFKICEYDNEMPLSPLDNGYESAMRNMKHSLLLEFRPFEPQYKFIPPRIIVEKHLPMDGLREFQWFTVNGYPVFSRCRCFSGSHKNVSYFTTEFGELPSVRLPDDGRKLCEKFEKPGAFAKMMEAVRILGRWVPGIVRIDLYVNDADVYFGELTFTTASCKTHFKPVVADRLLHALLYGNISPSKATPEFVERLMNQTPWFLVTLKGETKLLTRNAVAAFSSESDLCNETDAPATCLDVSKTVRSFPLRCIVVEGKKDMVALGQKSLPWISTLIRGLEIPLVLGIVSVLMTMVCWNLGGKQGSPIRHNAFYILAVTVYNYLKPHCKSLASRPVALLTGLVRCSFHAFDMVHPVENKFLALAHFATYWIAIAAWQARTPRRILVWWLLYEVVAHGLSEFWHHLEEYDEIRCARMSFIYSMEHSALDEAIRKYVLPPLFVYGYYLPKQILYWLGLVNFTSGKSSFQTFLNI